MARSRNIKPGFFTNEDLVELTFATRLLFAGLWTLADREGRLEDRPKKIKIGVFPADDVNVDAMLQELHDAKFVQRYEVNGVRYVKITNWYKHQNPHHTEKPSVIPDANGEITVKPRRQSVNNDAKQPGANGEITVNNLASYGGNLADSLIPDSLIPYEEAKASLSTSSPAAGQQSLDGLPEPAGPEPSKPQVPPCPYSALLDLYEKHCPTMPRVRRAGFSDSQRGKAMRARWAWVLTERQEFGDQAGERMATTTEEGIAWFEKYFAHVATSDFLTGRNGAWTSCDIEFLMTQSKFISVLEGKYHREDPNA